MQNYAHPDITMFTLMKLTYAQVSSKLKVGAISALCTLMASACLTTGSIHITTWK